MDSESRKRKTSEAWKYFIIVNSDKARCDLCKQTLSYKTSVTNLRKHIERKHPLVNLKFSEPLQKQIRLERKEKELENSENQPQPSCSKTIQPSPNTSSPATAPYVSTSLVKHRTQENITQYMPKKMGVSASSKINDCLMELFTEDFQPFSIVEDKGFRRFVSALNPSYQIPGRKTVSKTFLPALYEKTLHGVKELLKEIHSVTITTDCWTSCNAESFIAVTAHFINSNFEIKSVLIECDSFNESHTSANLASKLRRVVGEWGLDNKILLTVSDNAANIKRAIKDELQWKHFGCFAHTINLIVQDGLKLVMSLLGKVKILVAYFKKSATSNAKFLTFQKNSGKEPKKLIQDVPTRWNSTFYMLERFILLEEAVRTTVAVVNKDLPKLTSEDWKEASEIVKVLKPFESVTKIMSGEGYVTASLVITITKGLTEVYSRLLQQDFSDSVKKVINAFSSGISERLGDLEMNNSLTISTFLDPRFKNIGFSNESTGDRAKKAVINMIANKLKCNEMQVTSEDQQMDGDQEEEMGLSIWNEFDKKVASFQPCGTAQSRAFIEVQRYLEDGLLNRSEDPMTWWREHQYNYPHLSELVKEKIVTVATSVPCERLFSKTGQLLNDRRTRLSAPKVKQLMFVNVNSGLVE